MPAPFRLYNTLTRSHEPFVPLEPGRVRIYVCGLTVYDEAHIGHARAMVVFDAFVRYLRHRGWAVTYVRNYTDVDDKIIDRASESGCGALELAERFIASFQDDAAGLGLSAPDHEPRVSRSIPEITAMIAELVQRGHAYEGGGSVWFSVETFERYGKLSGQKVGELRSADAGGGKRHPADFALWKQAKPGEPAWDSPWGPGRPGWHIECSAMCRRYLGERIDIHGGGLDLVFPHHENELAQSECATGAAPFAGCWMHNGLLALRDSQKMGKSLGNAVNVKRLLEQFPAEAIRLFYLQNHYRSPLLWEPEALPDALMALARLYDAYEAAEAMRGEGDAAQVARELGADATAVLELSSSFKERFHAALDDDFGTPAALALAFELARAVNRLSRQKAAQRGAGPIARQALAAFDLLKSLGLLAQPAQAFAEEVKAKRAEALGIDRARVEQLLAERDRARASKDWARADALRDELAEQAI